MDILLVCTGNTCRSSMAEGIFNQILNENDDDDVHVTSAGISVYVSSPASEEAVSVTEDMGIDISDHMSTQISEDMVRDADLILVMTTGHKNILIDIFPEYTDKIYTLLEYAYGSDNDITDPFGMGCEVYRKCATEIKGAIEKVYDKIKNK